MLGLLALVVYSHGGESLPIARVVDAKASEAGTLDFEICLSRPSDAPIRLRYATGGDTDTAMPGTDYEPASGTLVLDPGQTEAIISVSLLDDAEEEANESLTLRFMEPENVSPLTDHPSLSLVNPPRLSSMTVLQGNLIYQGNRLGFFAPAQDVSPPGFVWFERQLAADGSTTSWGQTSLQEPPRPLRDVASFYDELSHTWVTREVPRASSQFLLRSPNRVLVPTSTFDGHQGAVILGREEEGTWDSIGTIMYAETVSASEWRAVNGDTVAQVSFKEPGQGSGRVIKIYSRANPPDHETWDLATTVVPTEAEADVKTALSGEALALATRGVIEIHQRERPGDDSSWALATSFEKPVTDTVLSMALGNDYLTILMASGVGREVHTYYRHEDGVNVWGKHREVSLGAAHDISQGPLWALHGASSAVAMVESPFGGEVFVIDWLEAKGTILDDEISAIEVGEVTVMEPLRGATTAFVPVALVTETSQSLVVDYEVVSGTATAGSDFLPSSGQLVFAPGERARTVAVPVLSDTDIEENEFFRVHVFHRATGDTQTAHGTITPHSASDRPIIRLHDAVIAEGTRGNVKLTLSEPSSQVVTADYRLFPNSDGVRSTDYVAASGTITFAPGEVDGRVPIEILEDEDVELPGRLALVLYDAQGATIDGQWGPVGTVSLPSSITASGQIVDMSDRWLVMGIGDALDEGLAIFKRDLSVPQGWSFDQRIAVVGQPLAIDGDALLVSTEEGLQNLLRDPVTGLWELQGMLEADVPPVFRLSDIALSGRHAVVQYRDLSFAYQQRANPPGSWLPARVIVSDSVDGFRRDRRLALADEVLALTHPQSILASLPAATSLYTLDASGDWQMETTVIHGPATSILFTGDYLADPADSTNLSLYQRHYQRPNSWSPLPSVRSDGELKALFDDYAIVKSSFSEYRLLWEDQNGRGAWGQVTTFKVPGQSGIGPQVKTSSNSAIISTLLQRSHHVFEPRLANIDIVDNDGDSDIKASVEMLDLSSISESQEFAAFRVTLSRHQVSTPVIVHFRTEDITARAGQDYESVSGHVIIRPGAVTHTGEIRVRLLNDRRVEPEEQFRLRLVRTNLGSLDADQVETTIVDDDHVDPGTQLFPSNHLARVRIATDARDESTWMLPDYDDSTWGLENSQIGYEREAGGDFLGQFTNDVGDRLYDKLGSVYLRIPFQLDPAFELRRASLRMRYDDGFVAYLNGTEIVARAAPEERTWNAEATRGRDDDEALVEEVSSLFFFKNIFKEGANVLAIQALNVDPDSSDFLIDPILEISGELLSPFDSWRSESFPNNFATELQAFVADPDRDGIPNGIEFVLGSDPAAVDKPVIDSVRLLEDGSLAMSTTLPNTLPGGVSMVVECSRDLQKWTPVAERPSGGLGWSGPATVLVTNPRTEIIVSPEGNELFQAARLRVMLD